MINHSHTLHYSDVFIVFYYNSTEFLSTFFIFFMTRKAAAEIIQKKIKRIDEDLMDYVIH